MTTGVCHLSTVMPDYLLYAATKGAIEQMTRVMSKGLAKKGITVNAVGPGPTATDLFFKGKSQQMLDNIKSGIPFGRFGEPSEIANVINFVCSDDSSWVTGQMLLANGGLMV